MVTLSRRPLILAEVEDELLRLSDELERETDAYDALATAAATAEADAKYAVAVVTLQSFDAEPKGPTLALRQARIDHATHDELRRWKIADARRAAKREMLLSLRARMEALRTLAASLRVQT